MPPQVDIPGPSRSCCGAPPPVRAAPLDRDALQRRGPQRRPQRRLDRRLEEVAEAVGGGYCRLQMPSNLALAVRGTVAGHRLGALEGGGGTPPPFQYIPAPGTSLANGQGLRAGERERVRGWACHCSAFPTTSKQGPPTRAVLNEEKKKKCSCTQVSQKSPWAHHVLVVGGWRLATGG